MRDFCATSKVTTPPCD